MTFSSYLKTLIMISYLLKIILILFITHINKSSLGGRLDNIHLLPKTLIMIFFFEGKTYKSI